MKINKLLLANRGEIALRIQRTAHRMGIETVAIYSGPDTEAKHVAKAAQSVYLPGTTLAETYLNIEAIIAAARKTGANAIHPGYGFLSENPLFSEACEREGIIFVGPSAASVRAMGNKIAAREVAVRLGVPVTSGITGDPEFLLANHLNVGFPMLIKAAAGGGGKGMRIVNSPDELGQALENTAREALNYFGDGTVYIEKYIENPRHIEVQVLGDQFGNMVHLFERECSAQRRHQKIVEEAPSPTINPEVRRKMGEAAVVLASSIGYYSAGTIEFLVDKDLNFYFLEMNTRIQVEHPVTELTTGIDLVEEQIRIASGHTLNIRQDDLRQNGHAIECRIYAEDPASNFMPSPGNIRYYREPQGPNIRVDGMELPGSGRIHPDFDPMIGKLIVWGEDREQARHRMIEALEHYVVQGIRTNISFLKGIMMHSSFTENTISTRYIDNHLEQLIDFTESLKENTNHFIPLVAGLLLSLENNPGKADGIWQTIGYWRFMPEPALELDGKPFTARISKKPGNRYLLKIACKKFMASLEKHEDGTLLNIDGKTYGVYAHPVHTGHHVISYNGFEFNVVRKDIAGPEETVLSNNLSLNNDPGNIVSPMPGKVLKINVSEGEKVKKGQVLLIVEAMKMENNILCPEDGVIDKLLVKEGDMVDGRAKLVHLEPQT